MLKQNLSDHFYTNRNIYLGWVAMLLMLVSGAVIVAALMWKVSLWVVTPCALYLFWYFALGGEELWDNRERRWRYHLCYEDNVVRDVTDFCEKHNMPFELDISILGYSKRLNKFVNQIEIQRASDYMLVKMRFGERSP